MRQLATALLCLAPAPALAQRVIDLTGKPAATIEASFTKISGVQELSPTLAVATDNMEAKVVLVDFARGTVKLIGAKGEGPNEYRFPSPPIAVPAGAYVFDTYQRRAILVGRNGVIAGMKQLPEGPLSRVRSSDAAGRVYFEGSDFDPNTGRFSDSLPVMRWDPASDKVERVARVWGGGRVIIQRKEGPASLAREITPFPHLDAWTALPDGRLALLRHEPFRIDFASPSGMITHGTPATVMPIAITARERDWYRERNTPDPMGAAMIGGGTGPKQQGRQWEDANFPLTMPTFIGTDVIATPEGEIWLPRSFTSTDKARKYDIYDASGKLTGSALLNPNARVVGFGPKSVYVSRVNPDDDLVYLAKYAR